MMRDHEHRGGDEDAGALAGLHRVGNERRKPRLEQRRLGVGEEEQQQRPEIEHELEQSG